MDFYADFKTKIRGMGILREGIRVAVGLPWSILDNLLATKKSQIVQVSGVKSLSSDSPILIYVHYSKTGVLTARENSVLENVRISGIQVLTVINSDSTNVPTSTENYTHALIVRKNHGYDLGAYRDAFFELKKENKLSDRPIVFMNNSVIWFPQMIQEYFKNLIGQRGDIIAASISYQYVAHVQTFLFSANTKKGLDEISEWLFSIKNWRKKRTIVRLGELGTQRFFSANATILATPDHSSLVESGLLKLHLSFLDQDNSVPVGVLKRLERNRDALMSGLPLNPSHDYWLEILESGFPGIKIDLIRSNPTGILDYEVMISKLISLGLDMSEIASLIQTNRSKSIVYGIRKKLRW